MVKLPIDFVNLMTADFPALQLLVVWCCMWCCVSRRLRIYGHPTKKFGDAFSSAFWLTHRKLNDAVFVRFRMYSSAHFSARVCFTFMSDSFCLFCIVLFFHCRYYTAMADSTLQEELLMAHSKFLLFFFCLFILPSCLYIYMRNLCLFVVGMWVCLLVYCVLLICMCRPFYPLITSVFYFLYEHVTLLDAWSNA